MFRVLNFHRPMFHMMMMMMMMMKTIAFGTLAESEDYGSLHHSCHHRAFHALEYATIGIGSCSCCCRDGTVAVAGSTAPEHSMEETTPLQQRQSTRMLQTE